MGEYILEMTGVTKHFPGVKALDNVSLKVKPGTVHALMGENGAGKSTLMKCLFGIYNMDSGKIVFDGKDFVADNPNNVLKKGIAMVHQELQPIPERSIAENIFCGRYPERKVLGFIPLINHSEMNREAETWLREVKLNVSPKTRLGSLSVSQMQTAEIAKALALNAKVVIMDEPTSSLTQHEVDSLFGILEELKKKGVAIIYISHKMDEILRISDEVSIMRDGKYIGTWDSKSLTTDFIITQMVGREMNNVYPKKTNTPGEVVLRVENMTSIHPHSFKDISFELRKGEVLGLGGLVGAQRTELMEALFGIRHLASGTVRYKDKELNISRPRDAIKNGIALLTEDRRGSGIFGVLSVLDNVAVASLDQYITAGVVLNTSKTKDLARDNIDKLSIKTPSERTQIQFLSGGNQQKVIIARWLANNPDVLILDEPTRGIDVGAKYEIYSIINDLTTQGKSVIMVSSEMPELIGMSDRIMVMCNGHKTGELTREEATQERIMTLAAAYN